MSYRMTKSIPVYYSVFTQQFSLYNKTVNLMWLFPFMLPSVFWLFSVYCSVVTKQFSLHDKNTILITIHYVLAVFRWHTFRSLCDSSRKLDLVLEVTADIPSEEAIQRWMAEPVKAIIVSTKLFMTNKKGYPVLSKPHQALIRRLYKVTCWTFVSTFCLFVLVLNPLCLWACCCNMGVFVLYNLSSSFM